ncbi:MAG: MotA/TolQ/ExbB proton channel family protein [Alphaproteobacteria bacterium]|nr:MotA/TolQ/ExbB proton channel family protein [Alphaproteobacteria bacterium]
MDGIHSAFSLIGKGGFTMFILVGLSVYALAVVIFKFWQFYKSNLFAEGFAEPALLELRRGNFKVAMQQLQAIHGPVARVAEAAVVAVADRNMTREDKEAEVSRVGLLQMRDLESQMKGLSMAANISPLLGLFGTVAGMITAFSRLEEAGSRVDPSVLAGGIWEALITTGGGLAVAIPALAAYHILDGIIDKVRASMKDVAVRILAVDEALRLAEIHDQKVASLEEQRKLIRQEHEERAQEIESKASEIQQWQEELRQFHEQLEAERKEIREKISSPGTSATLRLLSPRYGS